MPGRESPREPGWELGFEPTCEPTLEPEQLGRRVTFAGAFACLAEPSERGVVDTLRGSPCSLPPCSLPLRTRSSAPEPGLETSREVSELSMPSASSASAARAPSDLSFASSSFLWLPLPRSPPPSPSASPAAPLTVPVRIPDVSSTVAEGEAEARRARAALHSPALWSRAQPPPERRAWSRQQPLPLRQPACAAEPCGYQAPGPPGATQHRWAPPVPCRPPSCQRSLQGKEPCARGSSSHLDQHHGLAADAQCGRNLAALQS